MGRVIDALEDLGILDDTLIYYISATTAHPLKAHSNGCFNEMATLNGMPDIETTEFLMSKIDDFGTAGLQPLRGGLGARDEHAISVDQAGGLALVRHPQATIVQPPNASPTGQSRSQSQYVSTSRRPS